MSLEERIEPLIDKVDSLNKEVSSLKRENAQLRTKVATLERKLEKKNSSNSSMPPSKDENRVRPNQSLRKKTGRKSGGQKGSKGTTLKMHETADHIIGHKVVYCSSCGEALVGSQQYIGKRQVIQINLYNAAYIMYIRGWEKKRH